MCCDGLGDATMVQDAVEHAQAEGVSLVMTMWPAFMTETLQVYACAAMHAHNHLMLTRCATLQCILTHGECN